MNKKSTIVFAYNSFNDPLFQNIVFQYVDKLAKQNFEFHIISFEQKEYEINSSEKEQLIKSFRAKNMYWYPLDYAYGKILILNKFRNLIDAFLTLRKIHQTYKPNYLLSFGNVAASYSALLSIFHSFQNIIIQYEPHSQFLLELKRWKRHSLKFHLLHSLENYARKKADHIMTGTQHMIETLVRQKTSAKLYRTPNASDPEQLIFNNEERQRIRKELNMEEREVFIYIGKLGELYYEKELIELFSGLYQSNQKAFFLLITGYDSSKLKRWFSEFNIPTSSYAILQPIQYSMVPSYISSADFGVIAIPPTPSQRFRSPLKTTDYLYCGLPYLVCKGISEDDDYATQNTVGVVLKDFSEEEAIRAYPKMEAILREQKETLRKRCRKVGLEYRSPQRVFDVLKEILLDS